MDPAILESMSGKPVVDYSQEVGKIALFDNVEPTLGFDLAEQSELVQAAVQAVESFDIPNSTLHLNAYDDDIIHVSKEVWTILPMEGSGTIPEGYDVALNNANMHRVKASIMIEPKEDGGYSVRLDAVHDGSFNEKIDGSSTITYYDIDAEGNFTSRDSGATTQEFGAKASDQEHGVWTIQAAQTLENNFATILGGQAQEFIGENRPSSAATSVDNPSAAESAINLSSIDFEKILSGDAPAADVKLEAVPQP